MNPCENCKKMTEHARAEKQEKQEEVAEAIERYCESGHDPELALLVEE